MLVVALLLLATVRRARPLADRARGRSAAPACSGRSRGRRSSRSRSACSSLAAARRSWWPVAAAVGRGRRRLRASPRSSTTSRRAPTGSRATCPTRRHRRRRRGRCRPGSGLHGHDSLGEPSIRSHWESLQGRDPHGHPPPAGLRARERGHDRAALRREAEGRRVELHGARRGDRDRRRAALPRVGAGALRRPRPRGLDGATAPPPGSPPALAATLALAIQTDAHWRALARVLLCGGWPGPLYHRTEEETRWPE